MEKGVQIYNRQKKKFHVYIHQPRSHCNANQNDMLQEKLSKKSKEFQHLITEPLPRHAMKVLTPSSPSWRYS